MRLIIFGLLATLLDGFVSRTPRAFRDPLFALDGLEKFATTNVIVQNEINDLQNAAILLAGLSYIVWDRRPRGSAIDGFLDVKKSNIPNNLGMNFMLETILSLILL